MTTSSPKPHVAKIVKEKICLGDATPSTVFARLNTLLFRSLSNYMRGRKLNDEDDLKSYFQAFFDSKPKEFIMIINACGIYDLPRRWRGVLLMNGRYIFER